MDEKYESASGSGASKRKDSSKFSYYDEERLKRVDERISEALRRRNDSILKRLKLIEFVRRFFFGVFFLVSIVLFGLWVAQLSFAN